MRLSGANDSGKRSGATQAHGVRPGFRRAPRGHSPLCNGASGNADPLRHDRCRVLTTAKPAGADTVFQSGQVFASVGFSEVNVYDPTSGNQLDPLIDNTDEPYTAGSAFDAKATSTSPTTSTVTSASSPPTAPRSPPSPRGSPTRSRWCSTTRANIYVGQQSTPYIAEFSPSRAAAARHRPAPDRALRRRLDRPLDDQCTFYYTTEGTDILRYNKCTNTQLPELQPGLPLSTRSRACR